MALETIRSDISSRGIATVTLNRPDRGNAFNQQMMDELHDHIQALGRDDRVRVIALNGAGKHFSAGADVGSGHEPQSEVKHTGFIDVFLALETSPKPTIAAVHGACIGGALAVIACCDVVISEPGAFFSIPEVRIGVTPVGVTPPLVRAMGLVNYRRYALSGERFGAAEAHRIGLVGVLCAEGALATATDQMADAFLHGAPGALSGLKAHLSKAYPGTIQDLHSAAAYHASIDTFGTPEALEGVAAFKEKRKPNWYPR